MAEKAVIDRIVDGKYAVLHVGEGGTEKVIPCDLLPAGAGEGTWLRVRFDGDQLVHAEVDQAETDRVRMRISEKMDRLRQRGRRLPRGENS